MSNSMDDAITRVDTMNNFPNVMKNLGVSAKDSEKAINKMSEKLKGLPTTVDKGALAVQRFTSKNEDVGKSTDMFLALNNALLAGGAGADVQASALEQISQAYAKGRPDMVEWRSLLTAMPAQANQLGKAFGMSASDLGDALRHGDISMDQFMDKVMQLNKTGVKGFDNFEVQARRATGGLRTNVINMKTAIVRGMADAFNSINTSLQKAKLPTIQQMIEKLTKKITDGFKAVNSFIAKIDWNKVIKAIKILTPIVAGLFAGFMAYKMVVGVLNAVAVAQALLNAVMMLNPIGLIIAGIVGFIAMLVVLYNKCTWFRNLVNGIFTAIKTYFKTFASFVKLQINIVVAVVKGIIMAVKSVLNFVKKNWKLILGFLVNPIGTAFALLYKKCEWFRNIVNGFVNGVKNLFIKLKNGVVNAFKFIVNFIKSVPGKIKAIPGKIKAVFTGLPAKLKEIGGNMIKGLWKGANALKDWVIDKIKGLGKGILKGMKKVLGIKSPSKEFMKLGQYSIFGYYQGLHTKKTELNKALSNLSTNIQKQLKGKSTNYKNIGKLMGQELISGIESSLKTAKETAQKFKETLASVDLFSNNKLTDLSQVRQQITDYASNLKKLKGKIPANLYAEIMGMNREEGLQYTNALLSMNNNALKDYVNNWNAIQSQATKLSNEWYESEAQSQAKAISDKYSKNLKTELSSLQTLMGKLGKNASKGLINGLLSQTKNLKGASKTMANNVINSLKKALKIKSPSRIMMELGEYTTQGYIEGIASMKSDLNKMMNDTFSLSPSMTGTMNNTLSPNVNVVNNVNVETDPLGQVVNKIKTFSGGAKNDYNYGFGG